MIAILSALASACEPSAKAVLPPDSSGWVSVDPAPGVPAGIVDPGSDGIVGPGSAGIVGPGSAEVAGQVVGQEAARQVEMQKKWPSGAALQKEAENFMAAGFMRKPSQLGFADLAYSDVALDCLIDDQGRISLMDGEFSGLYESYSFGIPVVQRRVDAISGSRQVNHEDVIVKLDGDRWFIQPVSLNGGLPFEVGIATGIEFVSGDMLTRIVKNGSVFTCTETRVQAEGQEELLVSWSIGQYDLGPVQDIRSVMKGTAGVPVVLSWEPGSIAGYIVRLPEGEAEFAQRLRWEPAGELETDRYNFLVLLTQRHGATLDIRDALGAVDPVWLALLMYDHVVTP